MGAFLETILIGGITVEVGSQSTETRQREQARIRLCFLFAADSQYPVWIKFEVHDVHERGWRVGGAASVQRAEPLTPTTEPKEQVQYKTPKPQQYESKFNLELWMVKWLWMELNGSE